MAPVNYKSNCLMGELSVRINFVNNKITFHSICFLYTDQLQSINAVEVQYKKANSIFNIYHGTLMYFLQLSPYSKSGAVQ